MWYSQAIARGTGSGVISSRSASPALDEDARVAMAHHRLREVDDAAAHLAEVVVFLGMGRQAERAAGPLQEGLGEPHVGRGTQRLGDVVLQQAMDENHVRPHGLGPGRRLLQDEAAEVGDELQIQPPHERAGRAGTRGRQPHLLQPQPECDVAALHHVDQPLGIGKRRARRVGEDGVALQLDEAERRRQLRDHQGGELGDDPVGVLQLGARQERRVAGDVGEDEVALLARALTRHCHGATRAWA